MQNWPLVISSIIDHAAREFGEREIVTRSVKGQFRRKNLKTIHSRARRVAKELVAEGVQSGGANCRIQIGISKHGIALPVWYYVPHIKSAFISRTT